MIEKHSYLIKIYGVVQGVGFRPFIKRLAKELAVAGRVKNQDGNVHILAAGSFSQLSLFVEKIKENAPFGAVIDHLEYTEVPVCMTEDFSIIDSNESLFVKDLPKETETSDAKPFIHIGVDLPICPNCERELYDKENLRYRHPFISCVSCGPRYSIIKSLPYDRCNTTMEEFPLCEKCESEYNGRDESGSLLREHAQTISCHSCGPELLFHKKDTTDVVRKEVALQEAINALQADGVIAVKGIGGYHFVCRPDSIAAVEKLRQLKKRDRKPFAVMFRDLEQLKSYCEVRVEEEALLLSEARPIVLLKRKKTSFVAEHLSESVYGGSPNLGAFLPYTAIQCLLLDACGPLVFTSANLTSEPIYYEDASVLTLASELDGILYHTRLILVPMDDSVVQVVAGRTQLIRRARGYVPTAIPISRREGEIFAAGGDLKAVFGFYRNGEAYLSQYIGDLEQVGNYELYQWNYNHMKELFYFQPKTYLADYNAGYFSHKMALDLLEATSCQETKDRGIRKVQHHHAHIASVMAEHALTEVIGVSFDGTGLGEDGAVWGSEFLLCKNESYERKGHLKYVPVVGYDNAAKNASLMAMCHLIAADIPLKTTEVQMLSAAIKSKQNTIHCSSMGRLFDAVAAILKICQYNSFEGECASLLETKALEGKNEHVKPLPFQIAREESEYVIDPGNLIRVLYQALEDQENVANLALAFHYSVVEMIREMCHLLRKDSGINKVALSGGVFVNRILLENTIAKLESEGFEVYINEQVPCGDGGIALGQLYLGQFVL